MEIKILFLLHLIFACCSANRVVQVEVKTSNCGDCGMGPFGNLDIELCGNGPQKCCRGTLDNAFHDDFNPGLISSFSGDGLGDCNGFEMGSKSDWTDGFMTLFHEGFDGGKFDWVTMTTDLDNGLTVYCEFNDFMESGDFQVGQKCRQLNGK